MINSSKKPTSKYHRFSYQPRNYDQKEKDFLKRRKILMNRMEEGEKIDVLDRLSSKKSRLAIRYDLIGILVVIFATLFFIPEINAFFESKHQLGGIGTYILLILLALMFIKSSKKA